MCMQGKFVSEKNWQIERERKMTYFLCICRGNLFWKNLAHSKSEVEIFALAQDQTSDFLCGRQM